MVKDKKELLKKYPDYTKGGTLKVYLGKELRKLVAKAQKEKDFNASKEIRTFLERLMKKYGY